MVDADSLAAVTSSAMMAKRKHDDRSWVALLYCAALPAALGALMAIAATLAGCDREPRRRAPVGRIHIACSYHTSDAVTCVVAGRTFECTRAPTWRCAQVTP